MGLDTTHNAWHGPYSSFNSWRKVIAKAIGLDLYEMEGFGGSRSWDDINDPLVPLLYHSDCDGILTPGECDRIATRLQEIFPLLPNDGANDVYYREKTRQFIVGCQDAASKNENIEFN